MSTRKVKYKPNEFIKPCPKCGNNTEFTIISEQVCEDGCEIWAVCKCGYDPTSYNEAGSGHRVEDVWGGCSDDNCHNAISFAWNDTLDELAQIPCYVPCICPDCDGTGIIIDYVAGCCRNPNEDGSCCNCPIPEPVPAQCRRCEATGYLRSEHGT